MNEIATACDTCASSKRLVRNTFRRIEVQCILHTLCNLRCKFCFEIKEGGIREDTTINIDYIKQLPDDVVALVLSNMEDANDINRVEISMMGGEMFYDNISDEVFDVYREFARDIQVKLKEHLPEVECKFKCLSNGVFTKHERVEKFLSEFNTRLILSYDPVDRFTTEAQKELWFKTFNYFKTKPEYNLTLSVVLTKRTIDAYLAGDVYFEKTGVGLFVDSNIYVPRLDYHEYLAGDNDLFNFFKWALDNGKFNISHLNNIIISYVYGICIPTCGKRSDFIFGEGFEDRYQSKHINKCVEESPLGKEYYYGKYADQIEDTTNCSKYKQPIGTQKRGCLMCEYYDRCPKVCWTQILFDKYELSECPTKRIYKYLDKNPTILGNYKQWRKDNEKNWLTV